MRELAVISDVGFGTQGTNGVYLRFTVNALGKVAEITMAAEGAARFILKEDIHNVCDLEGVVCVVDTGFVIRFVELFKPVAQLRGETK